MLRIILVNSYNNSNTARIHLRFIKKSLHPSPILKEAWDNGEIVLEYYSSYYNFKTQCPTEDFKDYVTVVINYAYSKIESENTTCLKEANKVFKSIGETGNFKKLLKTKLTHSDKRVYEYLENMYRCPEGIDQDTEDKPIKEPDRKVYTRDELQFIFSKSSQRYAQKAEFLKDYKVNFENCEPLSLRIIKNIFKDLLEMSDALGLDISDSKEAITLFLNNKHPSFNVYKYVYQKSMIDKLLALGIAEKVGSNKIYYNIGKFFNNLFDDPMLYRRKGNKVAQETGLLLKHLMSGTVINKDNEKEYAELVSNFYEGICKLTPHKKSSRNKVTTVLAKMS